MGIQYLRRCESRKVGRTKVRQKLLLRGTSWEQNDIYDHVCDMDGSFGPYSCDTVQCFCTDKYGDQIDNYQTDKVTDHVDTLSLDKIHNNSYDTSRITVSSWTAVAREILKPATPSFPATSSPERTTSCRRRAPTSTVWTRTGFQSPVISPETARSRTV